MASQRRGTAIINLLLSSLENDNYHSVYDRGSYGQLFYMMEDLINAVDDDDMSRADSAISQLLTTLMDWTQPDDPDDPYWNRLASGQARF